MPIQVICPSCGAKLKVPDQMAGKVGKCPNCQKQVQVPPAPAASPPPMPRGAPPGPSPSVGAPPPMPRAAPLGPSPSFGPPPPIPVQGSEFPWLAGAQGQYGSAPAPAGDRWPIVRVGLGAAEGGTLVGAVSAFCMALMFALTMFFASNPMSAPPAFLIRVLPLLILLGMAGTYSTWVVMVTGWSVCLAGAGRTLKGTIGGAVGAMAAVFALALVLVAFTPMRAALSEGPMSAMEDNAVWMRLLICLWMAAVGAAYALFAAFLQGIANRTGNRSLGAEAMYHIVYVAVLGGWLVLSVLLEPVMAKSNTLQKILPYNFVAILAAMVFHFLWLRSLTAQARRALRSAS